MADLEISKDTYEKYNTNGKLRLTAGAIQRMMEGPMEKHNVHFIVQVLNYRKGDLQWDNQENYRLVSRMRLSDGVFQFAGVVVEGAMEKKLENDRFEGKGSNEIIAVKSISLTSSLKLKRDQENTMTIIIHDYQLLSRGNDQVIIGNDGLRSHPGEKETHAGYHPSGIGEVEWHEARKFAVDDKLAGPPAAKRGKDNNGSTVESRAPPPPSSRTKSGGDMGLTPIAMITPYLTKFRICGVCSGKEDMRIIQAKNMKVFNFELTDKDGCTIRISSFNETAEALNDFVQPDCSYLVVGGAIKGANKRFNSTGHDYEITVRSNDDVKLSTEAIHRPPPTFKFCPLSNIMQFLNQQIDVLVVIDNIAEPEEFSSKAGRQLTKREVKLVDSSETEAALTLWNDSAKNFDTSLNKQVVAIKNALVKEFQGGYSLTTIASTRIIPSPELPEVVQLYNWYLANGDSKDMKKLSSDSVSTVAKSKEIRMITSIQKTKMGKDAPVFINVVGVITSVSSQYMVYKSCPTEKCLKKVIDVDGEYRCEKCNITGPNYKYNYLMNFEISDVTGHMYVTAFSSAAQKIMQLTADEIGAIKERNAEEFHELCQKPLFEPRVFRIKARYESYNDELKQKFNVLDVFDVPHDGYQKQLSDTIEKLEAMEPYQRHR